MMISYRVRVRVRVNDDIIHPWNIFLFWVLSFICKISEMLWNKYEQSEYIFIIFPLYKVCILVWMQLQTYYQKCIQD